MAFEPTTLFVVVLGVRIAIRLDDPSAVGRIMTCLPPSWCLCSPAKIDRVYRLTRTRDASWWTLFGDDVPLAQTGQLDALCDRFRDDLERFVAINARTHAVIRAVVVGWKGRAIVISRRSSNGRMSLVDGLIELGAEYYSGGYALIDVRGRVSPFLRPQSTRPSVGGRELCALKHSNAPWPLPIGWIVVDDNPATHPETSQPLTRTHALRTLLLNAPAARTQPEFLRQILRTAVRDAIVLAAPRGSTAAAAYQLLANCIAAADLRAAANP